MSYRVCLVRITQSAITCGKNPLRGVLLVSRIGQKGSATSNSAVGASIHGRGRAQIHAFREFEEFKTLLCISEFAILRAFYTQPLQVGCTLLGLSLDLVFRIVRQEVGEVAARGTTTSCS